MITNSRDLFFVRKVQVNFYFKKNNVVQSLFFLENILFKSYATKNEVFLANIKLKWLIDQISIPNEIDKSLLSLTPLINNQKTRKYLLNLLEDFSNIINYQNKNNFIQDFKKFNSTFNKIIFLVNENFTTSYEFQILIFFYITKNNGIKKYRNFLFKTKKKLILQKVFLLKFF